MDKKKKNLQEMYKLGFTNKTLSLLSESQIEMILEKIKKSESKEMTVVNKKILDKTIPADVRLANYCLQNSTDEKCKNVEMKENSKKRETKEVQQKTSYVASKDEVNSGVEIPAGTTKVKMNQDGTAEFSEGKKLKKKYNPWAVCTASVGRKNKKKYEDCVMGVKKKIKEGRNPYEYLIESKMEEIVENNLSPKMTKGELLSIITEKKMMTDKPIGKLTSVGGETMEGDTKTAPAPTRTTPKTEPGTRPSHPGRKSKEQPNPKPKAKKQASDSEMESKKSEIITAIFNLIDKVN